MQFTRWSDGTRQRKFALGPDSLRVADVDGSQQLRVLCHSLENAVRSVLVAQNELGLISKLPPETLVAISEFVAEPRTRESLFEIVKLTHVCQY